jgi:hypothetical protein
MVSDGDVEDAIEIWEATFVEACGQWFEPIDATVTFDGDGSTSKLFSVPIISVSELSDLELSKIFDASDYVAYTGRTLLQDDRRNPKIMLKNGRLFELGRGKYQVVGTFGFTEADGSCPPRVRNAMLRLIIEKLLTPIVPALASPTLPPLPESVGQLVEEETDEHKKAWANPNNSSMRNDVNQALSKDPFVLETIQRYQAPMAIGAPVTWDLSLSQRNIFNEIFG